MSSLYTRGRVIWIAWSDKFKARRRTPTPFTLPDVEVGKAKPQYPQEVLAWKRKFDAANELGMSLIQRSGGLHFSEAAELYMRDRGCKKSPATQFELRLAVRRFQEEFLHGADPSVQEIDVDTMLRFRDWLSMRTAPPKKLPKPRKFFSSRMPTTEAGRERLAREWKEWKEKRRHPLPGPTRFLTTAAAKTTRALSPIFSYLEEMHFIERSPMTASTKVRQPKVPIVIFNEAEIDQLLDRLPRPMYDQVCFLAVSGFRVGESCEMQWTHVDFPQGILRVWDHKAGDGGAWEIWPMDEEVLNFMARLPRDYAPFVFKYRNVGWVSRKVNTLIRSMNLTPGTKLHTLRKNFTSRLVNSGATQSELEALTRDSIATIHKYYTAFSHEAGRQALRRARRPKKGKG